MKLHWLVMFPLAHVLLVESHGGKRHKARRKNSNILFGKHAEERKRNGGNMETHKHNNNNKNNKNNNNYNNYNNNNNNNKHATCDIKLDLGICYQSEIASNRTLTSTCNETPVCQKDFNITYVQLQPYSAEIVVDLVRTCCGSCAHAQQKTTIQKVAQITPNLMETSHFVFPILSRVDTETVYGYPFMPLVVAPHVYYITKKHPNILGALISSCLNMWPLVVVCCIMVVISGFVCWLMETWSNKEEFPRSFMIGWCEGIWWSFISMTTVGYGDKSPRSFPARFFAVIWIVLGITTFSFVTAMLTSEITYQNSPPPPTMSQKQVGSIRHHLYESMLIAEHDGIVVETPEVNITEGIHYLVKSLQNNRIQGFVLDRYTLLLFYTHFQNDPRYKPDIDFIKGKTILTNIHYDHELAYGAIVRNVDDYRFFINFIENNKEVINTCNSLFINNKTSQNMDLDEEKNLLFSVSGQTFSITLSVLLALLVLICCFGLLYEFNRKARLPKPSTTKPNMLVVM